MDHERAAVGAIHHRFGIGDGFVMILDEWDSVDSFQKFFSNPELRHFIGTVGAAPVPPELTVAVAVTSADQF